MRTIDIKDAVETLAEYVEHSETLPIVVTSRGKPVAALLAIPNTDMETVSLSTNPQFLALIERSRERQAREGGVTSEEMRRRLEAAHD